MNALKGKCAHGRSKWDWKWPESFHYHYRNHHYYCYNCDVNLSVECLYFAPVYFLKWAAIIIIPVVGGDALSDKVGISCSSILPFSPVLPVTIIAHFLEKIYVMEGAAWLW